MSSSPVELVDVLNVSKESADQLRTDRQIRLVGLIDDVSQVVLQDRRERLVEWTEGRKRQAGKKRIRGSDRKVRGHFLESSASNKTPFKINWNVSISPTGGRLNAH